MLRPEPNTEFDLFFQFLVRDGNGVVDIAWLLWLDSLPKFPAGRRFGIATLSSSAHSRY